MPALKPARPRSLAMVAWGIIFTAVLAACGGGPATSPGPAKDVGKGSLTGAGSTFIEPFFQKAFFQYSQIYPAVTINYQGVGSGAGIQQFGKNVVDFGASDVPMTKAELDAAGGADSLVQIPAVLGVAAMAYNLPGVDRLQLDGQTLAGIYLGSIKRWDDPALKALNSGVSMPAREIAVVHRSDGSGTTYMFTDYLARVSPDWQTKVGVGKAVQWPAGIGAKGTEGVASAITQQEGALGYVELAYTIQAKLKQAYLKNSTGKFLQASVTGATAAASQVKDLSPTKFSIVNQPGDASYPIASYTWVFLRTSISDVNKGKALVYLFGWVVNEGQKYGQDLQYAPMPQPAQELALNSLKTVRVNGAPALS